MSHHSQPPMSWRTVLPAALFLVLGLVLFTSTVHDDSYISYWVAHSLAEKGQLVNYNGEAVEQSSSLTFVVLIALLSKVVPLSISTIAPLVSILAGMGTVLLVQRMVAAENPALAFFGGMLAASSSALVYWSFSGMETSLAAFLGVWLLLAYLRVLREDVTRNSYAAAAAATLLYLLVRPEAVFIAGTVLTSTAGVLWMRMALERDPDRLRAAARLRRIGILGLITVATFSAILVFRVVYFGDVFPQPVRAKVGGPSLDVIKRGVSYLIAHAWARVDGALWILALPASAYILLRGRDDEHVHLPETLAASFVGAHLTFVAISGGDFMEVGRFLVQGLPAAIVVGLAFVGRAAPVGVLRTAAAIVVGLNLLGTALTARNESVGSPLWARDHLNSLPRQQPLPWFDRMNRNLYAEELLVVPLDTIVQRLQQQKRGTISIMTGNMGVVPYRISSKHFGVVRFIDLVGLASRDFVECPVSSGLRRTRFGLNMTYPFFFDHRRELADTCGLGDPDILVTVDGPYYGNSKRIEANGYSIAYYQKVRVTSGSGYLRGGDVDVKELIAVRNDIMSSSLQLGTHDVSR
jgi:hypothetical protein